MLAGIIAAVSNNNLGIAGLGSIPIATGGAIPVVNLFAIKIDDARNPPTALSVALGIFHALAQHARVINASWHVLDQGLLYNAISAVSGLIPPVLVVTAAGNDGSDNMGIPTLPASYRGSVRGKLPLDNLISVMASDVKDNKPWFSNYGANVDLAAPGVGILSTSLYFAPPSLPATGPSMPPPLPPTAIYDPAYRTSTGTSAAAAHVTGAAALLLAIDDWTPQQIRDHLVASADQTPGLHGTCLANGRLNLRRAVTGPFAVTSPGGGAHQRGSAFDVVWGLNYNSPVVQTVQISINDHVSGQLVTVLNPVIAANAGLFATHMPTAARSDVVVRVRCLQKNLYADSAPFDIV